jgi:tyrosyl-tRNA synthetase
MFGKTMALPDEAIIQVFIDCTYFTMDEIGELEKSLKAGANPRDLKIKLAHEIVKMYHSEKDAQEAEEYFISTFSKKQTPDEMPEIKPSTYDIIAVLVESKVCKSKSEARQMIEQGGVKVNEEKVTTFDFQTKPNDVVQKGSRHFLRLK